MPFAEWRLEVYIYRTPSLRVYAQLTRREKRAERAHQRILGVKADTLPDGAKVAAKPAPKVSSVLRVHVNAT